MNEKTGISLLEDVEIPRVDIVAQPAVGRRFLLLKNQEVEGMGTDALSVEDGARLLEAQGAAEPTVANTGADATASATNPTEELVASVSEEEQTPAGQNATPSFDEFSESMEKRLVKSVGKKEATRLLKALQDQEEAIKKANEAEKAELNKQISDARTQVEELTKAVEQERTARERREFVDVVKGDIAHIPGTVEDNAGLLFTISKRVEKGEFDKLMEMLKATNAVAGDITKAVGTTRAESEPQEILKSRAQELIDRDSSLTLEKAKARVLQNDPELYRRLRNEEVG